MKQNLKPDLAKLEGLSNLAAEQGEYAIDVRGLSKSFGKRKIIDDIDIKVKRGSVCGFLGPNGSGKTTAIRILCGLLGADEGGGRCLGYDFRKNSEQIRLNTGYMTQKFGWYDDLSVRENLEFIARLFALPNVRGAVDEILARLDLAPRQNQLAGGLSGGWKQRLALAMCLVHKPKLLLLDEPTAGVDPKARREFWDIIHELASEGVTALVSTHYMDEAERCHELIYIAYGKILAQGTQADIIARHALDVWTLSSKNTQTLSKAVKRLENEKFIDSISVFGNVYHIVTNDANALKNAILKMGGMVRGELYGSLQDNKFNKANQIDVQNLDMDLILTKSNTTLEDVFIHLLENFQSNFN